MSYVRITNTLKEQVSDKIEKMKMDAQAPYDVSEPREGTDAHEMLTDLALEVAWAPYKHLQSMPDDWKSSIDNFIVEYTTEDGNKYDVRLRVSGYVKGFPPSTSRWSASFKAGREHASPKLDAWFASYGVNKAKHAELATQYDNIKPQVLGLFDAYPSLNAILKAVPEIAMYVDQYYIDKVNEKANRSGTSAKVDPLEEMSIDVDAIAAAAIAHRMSTALA